MTTKTDLEKALAIVAPVVASLSLAIECKRLKRSQLQGSVMALRKAADLLEGI